MPDTQFTFKTLPPAPGDVLGFGNLGWGSGSYPNYWDGTVWLGEWFGFWPVGGSNPIVGVVKFAALDVDGNVLDTAVGQIKQGDFPAFPPSFPGYSYYATASKLIDLAAWTLITSIRAIICANKFEVVKLIVPATIVTSFHPDDTKRGKFPDTALTPLERPWY